MIDKRKIIEDIVVRKFILSPLTYLMDSNREYCENAIYLIKESYNEINEITLKESIRIEFRWSGSVVAVSFLFSYSLYETNNEFDGAWVHYSSGEFDGYDYFIEELDDKIQEVLLKMVDLSNEIKTLFINNVMELSVKSFTAMKKLQTKPVEN